jgi:hypothetical protein
VPSMPLTRLQRRSRWRVRRRSREGCRCRLPPSPRTAWRSGHTREPPGGTLLSPRSMRGKPGHQCPDFPRRPPTAKSGYGSWALLPATGLAPIRPSVCLRSF